MNQHLHVLHVELHNIIMEFFYVQQTHIFYILNKSKLLSSINPTNSYLWFEVEQTLHTRMCLQTHKQNALGTHLIIWNQ